MAERPQVSDETLLKVTEMFVNRLAKKLEKHGRGKFANTHEALGALTEEFCEVGLACRGTDFNDIAEENFDVAVAAIFAVASMMTADDTEASEEAPEVVVGDDLENRAARSGLYIASDLRNI